MKKEFKIHLSSESTVDEKARTVKHYISTKTIDRYGDIVEPAGMVNDNFMKNPIVLWAHGGGMFASEPLPIGKSLWQTPDDFGVKALTYFAKHQLADDIFNLIKENILNAWSIGFIPINASDEIRDGEEIRVYKKWELLEYSSVPIPANPDALNMALKGIKTQEVKEVMGKIYLEYETDKQIKALLLDFKNLTDEMILVKNKISENDNNKKIDEIKKEFDLQINKHKTWITEILLGIVGDIKNINASLITKLDITDAVAGAIRKHTGKLG